MVSPSRCEIIATGTELLMGETADTNSNYLASQLRLLGIELSRITVVGDDKEQICQVLRQAIEKSELVITTGGLGPTQGDMTRQCIADVLGEELAVDAELEKRLRSFFTRLNREMSASNLRQAMLIPSAQPIINEQGTAPGWWVEKESKVIVTLPGPPRELQRMWQKEVQPRLQEKFPGKTILTRTIKIYGLPEATAGEMVKPLLGLGNPSLGVYAKTDGIHIRLIAQGDNATRLLQTAEQKLEQIFAGNIWGKDKDNLQAMLGKWFIKNKKTLATVEYGTRGLLASMLSNAESSKNYYCGGLVVCSNKATDSCALPPELTRAQRAISAEAAQSMAVAAREKFSADFGLSTTGIAGLDGSEQAVPGLAYIGLADGGGTISWQQNNLPYRDEARGRMATAAIFRLNQRLTEMGNQGL